MPRKNEGKKASLNLKIHPTVLEEFQAACRLRGATMSGILSLRIEQVIREEKANNPAEFTRMLADLKARQASESSFAELLPSADTLMVEDVYMSSPEASGKVTSAARKDIADAKAAVKKLKSQN